MKKFDVIIALEGLREARVKWGKARTEFSAGYETVLTRLLHEAAANYMSPNEVATALAVTPKAVRTAMRNRGLDSRNKTVLSKIAAEALANNAAIMGIEPHEMDLMSPLAYLPMGSEMRKQMLAERTPGVTEVSGNEGTAYHDGEVVSGYTSISEAVHDLHLRGGRLRYTCPVCGA